MQPTRCKRVKYLKYFYVESLHKRDRSSYTTPWKQPTYLTKVSTVLIWLYAVLLWFDSLIMVPCIPKHMGLRVIIIYKI